MRRAALLLAALLLVAGCGGDDSNDAASTTAAAADGVEKLANVLDLRSDFEADEGKTRVIVLLSPT
jgi:ABC-type glycerol-3-phosphate transport system substrate-binding protein